MIERTGRRTVPEILIDDELIGGFDDLWAYAQSGSLDKKCLNVLFFTGENDGSRKQKSKWRKIPRKIPNGNLEFKEFT